MFVHFFRQQNILSDNIRFDYSSNKVTINVIIETSKKFGESLDTNEYPSIKRS